MSHAWVWKVALVAVCLTAAAAAAQADDSGSIVAWGDNNSVPVPNTGFVAIAAGLEHGLGLKSDGSVAAWGDNAFGQFNVPSPNSGFVAIAAGPFLSLGLKFNGSVVAWGYNGSGQCNVPSPNSGFVAIAGGGYHSLGLKSNSSVVAWGSNTDWLGNYCGQCDVPSPNLGFVAIAAGAYHSLGLKSNGSVVAWGLNNWGQRNVPSPNSGFVALAAGPFFSLGLRCDGSIAQWGLGYGPVPSPNSGFVAIAGGDNHGLGLKSNGSVVAWGLNNYGQCNVPSPNSGFFAVAAGGNHSLGLTSDTPVSLPPFPPPVGSLRVTIQPAEAVAEGGRWRRTGTTTWRESGETETGLPIGVYRIEFKDLATWVKLGQLVYLSPLGADVVIQGYRPYWPGEAKRMGADTPVRVSEVVSAAWDDVFYLEASNRSGGIRVEKTAHGLAADTAATVIGPVKTNADGERYIEPTTVTGGTTATIGPLGMSLKSIGGGDFLDPITGIGQQGVIGGVGLNNIGLLVRVWGRVTEMDSAPTPAWLKLDDGSGRIIKCITEGGSPVIDPAWLNHYAAVTGISSCEFDGPNLVSLVRMRPGADPVVY